MPRFLTERPRLPSLAALARRRGVLLIKDLGGGALFDLAPHGIDGEPTARACVDAGADVVCFSTDKALGGLRKQQPPDFRGACE